jgi:hypothetical protein
MAKVSFSKTNAEGPSVTADETTKQEPEAVEASVVENTATEIVPAAEAGMFIDEDEIGLDEITLPRINIVQKVGPLSEEFTPGQVVLNKELVIFTIPEKGKENEVKPIEFTTLAFRKTIWAERIEGGALGRNARSLEQVREFGGTTDYNLHERSKKDGQEETPLFQPLATALVLIKRPEGVDEDGLYFTYDHDGQSYAIAQWSMKGSAFTAGAKVIKTARKIGHLAKGGLTSCPYLLTTRVKSYPGNRYAVIPVLRPGKRHSPEFKAFADSVLNVAPDSE